MAPVSPTVLDHAADVLASAFADYPMFARAIPSPVRRHAGLPLMWRALAEQFNRLPHGSIDLSGEPALGAAIWGDGQLGDLDVLHAIRYGHLRFALATGLREALGLMRVQDEIARVHREIISEPHLYLLGIGVRPGHQGKGIGTGLLRLGHARADDLGLPCYLETNLERDAALYQREGYLTVRRGQAGGMDTWYMLRPAR